MRRELSFLRFAMLWFVCVGLGMLVVPDIYAAYSHYVFIMFDPVLTVLYNFATQPTLALSGLVLMSFPTFGFLFSCWVLHTSRLPADLKLQEMQAVLSGMGFGLFFITYAFGLTLAGYNRTAVLLCATVGLVVLLGVYRWKRDKALKQLRNLKGQNFPIHQTTFDSLPNRGRSTNEKQDQPYVTEATFTHSRNGQRVDHDFPATQITTRSSLLKSRHKKTGTTLCKSFLRSSE